MIFNYVWYMYVKDIFICVWYVKDCNVSEQAGGMEEVRVLEMSIAESSFETYTSHEKNISQ